MEGPSGGSFTSEKSKQLGVTQVGEPVVVDTPPPHVFTKSSRRDGTSLDKDDKNQKPLVRPNATSDGQMAVQLPDGRNPCLERNLVDQKIFNPFDHLPDSPYVLDKRKKPPHRYATLIGMAILSPNNRRLTLVQTYQWISDTFTYYSLTESDWQNSIRHNLRLNKDFVTIERSRQDRFSMSLGLSSCNKICVKYCMNGGIIFTLAHYPVDRVTWCS